MNLKLSNKDARFSAVFLSPLDRIASSSTWTKIFAAAGAVYQYVRTDAFAGALFFVIAAGIVDYWIGVKAAKSTKPPTYDPLVAHRGALGKVTGVLLLLFIRAFEHYLHLQGLLADFHGMGATALAISLFAVDLQSIAHHREELGAQAIPVWGAVMSWLQRIASSKLPPRSRRLDRPYVPPRVRRVARR
jgi:hypothetical protein